ncbi:MAG: NIPSNAP family protein [Ginsengibacter sp.]
MATKKIAANILLAISILIAPSMSNAKTHDIYQVKIYHLKNNDQTTQMDTYLQNVYLPALHRLGIKNIGVFKPIANDTAAVKFIYVIIPFASMDAWAKLDQNLAKNQEYMMAAKSFIEAPFDKAPYERMESVLLDAFPGQEHLVIPSSKNPNRVFELRSYESPTQHLAEKKMAMFNTGSEIQIFNRLKFNPVFYAKVISGSHMPNFMYMPIFDNVEQRDAQWKVFGSDAKWKEISTDPGNENKVSVSHIDSILMHSTSYSDY